MTRAPKLRAAGVALMATLGGLLAASNARAANLDELSKYLAFIEGFQHFFEYCQAETKLPDGQVSFARAHIGERRALIFSGLNEMQRERITSDMPAKRAQMIRGVMDSLARD